MPIFDIPKMDGSINHLWEIAGMKSKKRIGKPIKRMPTESCLPGQDKEWSSLFLKGMNKTQLENQNFMIRLIII